MPDISFNFERWEYEIEQLTSPDDHLQLAAELGKTLLERNKELENTVNHHQNIIDDQAQEIVYLQKQTAALREVNDSRLKIYEQLEVGIQDLERTNHRLGVENTSDKKHIKSLLQTIESLEVRNDELNQTLEEVKEQLSVERRKNQSLLLERDSHISLNEVEDPDTPENCNFLFETPNGQRNANSTGINLSHDDSFNICNISNVENEEFVHLVTDLENTRKALASEQQRTTELEEQLVAIIQENQTLHGRIHQNSTLVEMKSVHEELSILDEFRQGNICNRFLRSEDDHETDYASSIAQTEDDDRSLMDMDNCDQGSNITSSVKICNKDTQISLDTPPTSPNPYKDLVEKYEALLDVQRHSPLRQSKMGASSGKASRATPADFSEGETSSSGFSDETSNMGTQTEDRPSADGYFLYSIEDDCKVGMYDEASPIDDRLRNRPEYRELFKEIFAALKKPAENKTEEATMETQVTQATPAVEDDSQSIVSSSAISEQSFAMSECITKMERKTAKKHIIEKNPEKKQSSLASVCAPKKLPRSPLANPTTSPIIENGRVLIPIKKEPLDTISVVGSGNKKKNRKKNRNFTNDRCDSPILPTPPRVYYSNGNGRKRRDMRPFFNTPIGMQSTPVSKPIQEWNGSSMTIYNRSNGCSRELNMNAINYRPSTVSQDLDKLKKLDFSYAEVLRQQHKRKQL